MEETRFFQRSLQSKWLNPQKEKPVAKQQVSFLQIMATDSIEGVVRDAIATELKASVGCGEELWFAMFKAFASVAEDGRCYKIVSQIDGFTTPLFGEAIAKMFQKEGFVESILPGDKNSTVCQAKVLFKQMASYISFGIGETIINAIKRFFAMFRSDSNITAHEGQNTSVNYDEVLVTYLLPEHVFWMSRDNEGNVRKSKDGVPIVGDPNFAQAKQEWDLENSERTVRRLVKEKNDGNKDKKKDGKPKFVTETISAKPMPYDILTFEDAVAQLSPEVRVSKRAVLEEIAKRIEELKKRSVPGRRIPLVEQISKKTQAVWFALSKTKSELNWLDRVVGEDFFKHVQKKTSPAHMNLLGEKFFSEINNDGKFKHDVFISILEYIDDWMEVDLSAFNKIRIAIGRARAGVNIKEPAKKVLKVALLSAIPFVLLAFAWLALFFVAGKYLMMASFADLSKNFLDSPNTPFVASGTIVITSFILIILLAGLVFWQKLFNILTFIFPSADKEWLTKKGRWLTFIIGVYGALLSMMALFSAPQGYRIMVAIVVLGSCGCTALLISAGFLRQVNIEAWKAFKVFRWVVVIIPFAVLLIGTVLHVFGHTPQSFLNWVIKVVTEKVGDNKFFQSFILLVIGLLIAGAVVKAFEITVKNVDGTNFVSRNKSWLTRFLLACGVIVLALSPWLGKSKEEVVAPVTTVEMPPQKVSPPVIEKVEKKEPVEKSVPAVKVPLPTKVKVKKTKQEGSKENTADPCEGYSYQMRKDLGCPEEGTSKPAKVKKAKKLTSEDCEGFSYSMRRELGCPD